MRKTFLIAIAACCIGTSKVYGQIGEPRNDLAIGFNAGYTLNQVMFNPTIQQKFKGAPTFGFTATATPLWAAPPPATIPPSSPWRWIGTRVFPTSGTRTSSAATRIASSPTFWKRSACSAGRPAGATPSSARRPTSSSGS